MAAKKAVQTTTKPAPVAAAETPKPKVDKHTKGLQIAMKRVPKALKAISLIGNLAAYKLTADEVAKIEDALGTTCAKVVSRLQGTTKDTYTFTFHQ